MKKKLLLLGTCLSVLLTSCSTPAKDIADTVQKVAENVSTATDAPAPTDTPAPEPVVLSLGKKATIGDWKICVKKAEIKNRIKNGKYRFYKPSKGNRFVYVTMTARNTGKEAATLFPRVGYENTMITATLLFKDEYEYKPTQLLSFDKDLATKSISPLVTQSGILAFEVPKKATKNKKQLSLRIGTTEDYVIYNLNKKQPSLQSGTKEDHVIYNPK